MVQCFDAGAIGIRHLVYRLSSVRMNANQINGIVNMDIRKIFEYLMENDRDIESTNCICFQLLISKYEQIQSRHNVIHNVRNQCNANHFDSENHQGKVNPIDF